MGGTVATLTKETSNQGYFYTGTPDIYTSGVILGKRSESWAERQI